MSMTSREAKRQKLIKKCGENHDFTNQSFRDPTDQRVILRPRVVQFGDDYYLMLICRKCGMGKLRSE